MGKLAPAKTPQEAVEMTKQALEIRFQRLPKDDPIMGATYGNLAMFTIATGDYQDSLRYSQECLDIRMMNETKEMNNFSVTHNYFGWCYAKMGDAEQVKGDALKNGGDAGSAEACFQKMNEYNTTDRLSQASGQAWT